MTDIAKYGSDVVDVETGEVLPSYSINGELETLQQAMVYLEMASSPHEAKRVADFAEVMRYTAQQANLGLEAQNEAAEAKIRAQRKCGEMLASMELKEGRPKTVNADHRFSLKDFAEELGISHDGAKKLSEKFQVLARIPHEKFGAKIAEVREAFEELTTALMVRYGRNLDGSEGAGSSLGGSRIFTEEEVIEAAFQHYRETGFPYRDLPRHVSMEQINRLATTPQNELMASSVGYHVADTYHPHRFDGHALGMNSPRGAFDDDKLLRRALRLVMEERGVLGYDLIRKLSIVSGTQANSNFRPGFACYMYREYCEAGATVLDTSTGYGGRLVGFMASGVAGKYIGVDPSTKVHEGNTRMARELGYSDAVELYDEPVEDVDAGPLENRCDFAFTSPPYFHKEVYADEESQSARRYRSAEQWHSGFLAPMLALQYAALKDGAISAVNIADVTIDGKTIPLVAMTVETAKDAGFTHTGSGKFQLQKRFGGGHAGADVSSEEVLFFRKGEA